MRHRIKKFESCWHFRDKENPQFSSTHYASHKRKIITTSRLINGTKMMLTYFLVLFHVFVLQTLILGVSSDSGLIDSNRLQAPRFITPPSASGSIVPEGRTKIFQCHALGFPQPEYRWMRDGVFLSEFSSEPFYKIRSVTKADAGSYQCYAKNSVGTIVSEKIPLVVAYMSTFKATPPQKIRVKSGHSIIFDLPPVDSVPTPSVTWQTEDNALLYGTKYAVTSDNRQIILSVDLSDQKRYRARATNTQLGQEESSAFTYLEVFGEDGVDVPPEIIVAPKDTQIIKGTQVTELQCIANAKPLYEVELIWFKDGRPIDEAGIAFSFNDLWNRTLSLINADFAHEGRYKCQVRMKTGGPRLTKEAKVNVIEKPHFEKKMPVETVGEFGREITIPCNLHGVPNPNVTWFRNGKPLSETPNLRFAVGSSGELKKSTKKTSAQGQKRKISSNDLKINFLRLEDSGMFQCSASNAAGDLVGYTWLRVKTSSPVMLKPPQNLTALDGKDATISCNAQGAPAPNITWFVNDGQLSFSGRIQILEDGSLLIAKVRSTDRGKYTCVRANEAGSVRGTAWLSVLVRTQIIQPPVDTKVILGHVASMQCRVSADPNVPFEVDWFHEGRLINAAASHRINIEGDGTLRIAEARASDAGEYTCEVSSNGGNDHHASNLDVIELPYTPTQVTAEKVSTAPKTVNVSWTAGFNGNSPIIKYILQYRFVPQKGPIPKDDLNWITALANISSSDRSVLLSHLRSSATYIFRVSTVNSVGEGPPSYPSNRIELPQEPPSGPPLGLVGSARSESEIMIQWKPPAEANQNGEILGYVVRYRLYGYIESPWSYRNITKHLQRTYLITEVITWKDYEIQIAAYNFKGVGSYASPIKVKTREGVPSASPTGVRAQAVESSIIKVWWSPPDPQKINGINQGYKIQAWRGDPDNEDGSIKGPDATVTVPPNVLNPLSEQSSLIDHLKPWTAYNITVLCFTSPGDGKRSPAELVRTWQDFPGPVANLRFQDITDRGVRVLWDVPEHANGIILGYTLRYMVKDMLHTLVERNLTEDVHSFYLHQLKPTTHYLFEVYALTEVGRGKASVATIQSGVEPVLPASPSRLAVSNIQPFSVVLQFTPGFDGNSSITKWTVEAKNARNTTWTTIYEITDPDADAIVVQNLTPYMEYQLRLIANNVVGPSEPSESTRQFQTIQAPPMHPPQNVTIRAMSATELHVRWIPLSQIEWYGIPRGYNISYRILEDSTELHSISIDDPNMNSFILDKLEEFTLYEVLLQAYNDLGSSDPSPVVLSRTREAVPGAGPSGINAEATSSTTILCKWGDVPKIHRNGIIEGYKVYYGAKDVPYQYKHIGSNLTKETTLTELKKYTKYAIQVLAYTRVGDGKRSTPPIQVTTHEDVPGPPSNLSFPDVSYTTARAIWDVPREPNGIILKYRVTYRLEGSPQNFTQEFLPTDRTFRAYNLNPKANYKFDVTAKTSLGWGYMATGLVYTTNNREAPQPPSAPQILSSQVQDREITFSWNPGRDGYAPFRYYTVQYAENGGGWATVPERVDPTLTSYTVASLQPFTVYKFRLQAVNDIGPSGWSEESNITKTLPSAPSMAVEGVKVTPISRTNVKVMWKPLAKSEFNGDAQTGGYYVEYRVLSDFPSHVQSYPQVELKGYRKNRVILEDLEIGKTYEILVIPYNAQGLGPSSPPISVYVGEAVPTGAPSSIRANAVSPTEISMNWRPPKADEQNGDLLGYKIFYHSLPVNGRNMEEIEIVSANHKSHSLIFLDMYTNYTISILAFNPAGDGPRSNSVSVKTLQGLPGKPSHLRFTEITMSTLKVEWDPPLKPNGQILGYLVEYETSKQQENYSKQVKQRVTEPMLFVHNLEEKITYTFTVKAQTIGYGTAVSGNVTTGPQAGAPERVSELSLTFTISAVKLSWRNGNSGKSPILGYYIESRRKDEDKWKTEAKTEEGAVQEYTISYQNLVPESTYLFRVIAYNKYSISYPAESQDEIKTPSKRYLSKPPFYREPLFLVALAAVSIVIIIVVVAILCVKSKSYKYKDRAKQQRLDETGVTSFDDAGYSTFEMRQSRRGTMKSQSRGTLRSTATMASRKSTATTATNNFAMINGSRNPPRPTPSMVNYSDEDSAKGYDENPDDSDSLTEKPSEISSTDSQGTESDQPDNRSNSDPHSFVNHYANVNSTYRHTWKKQKPIAVAAPRAGTQERHRKGNNAHNAASSTAMSNNGTLLRGPENPRAVGGSISAMAGAIGGATHQPNGAIGIGISTANSANNAPVSSAGGGIGGSILTNQQLASTNPRGYSSFTESDQDGSSAVVSLNGTQIVMNNMARSRAPLPGFSSFV